MLTVPLAEIDESGVEIDAMVPAAALQPEGVEALPVEAVHVAGVLEDIAGDYLFRGEISGTFTGQCDRCLQDATAPFAVEVMWNFEQDPKAALEAVGVALEDETDLDDSAICRPIVGDEIDLKPHAWEELVLAYPAKFLCREDCRGLCARCGANLNEGPCACAPEADGDSPLAGLGKLFPDLAPPGS